MSELIIQPSPSAVRASHAQNDTSTPSWNPPVWTSQAMALTAFGFPLTSPDPPRHKNQGFALDVKDLPGTLWQTVIWRVAGGYRSKLAVLSISNGHWDGAPAAFIRLGLEIHTRTPLKSITVTITFDTDDEENRPGLHVPFLWPRNSVYETKENTVGGNIGTLDAPAQAAMSAEHHVTKGSYIESQWIVVGAVLDKGGVYRSVYFNIQEEEISRKGLPTFVEMGVVLAHSGLPWRATARVVASRSKWSKWLPLHGKTKVLEFFDPNVKYSTWNEANVPEGSDFRLGHVQGNLKASVAKPRGVA